MNSMTFQKDGDYIICYINGKEMGRAKMASIGISEEDIEQMIEANPEGEATATLNKIKLFNTIYALSGGTTYTAGANIQISEEGVISATDTTYTAGTGITITDGVISASGGSTHLYEHDIRIKCSASGEYGEIMFKIFNNVSTPYTNEQSFRPLGTATAPIFVNGYYGSNDDQVIAVAMYYDTNGSSWKISTHLNYGDFQWRTMYAMTGFTVYDTVRTLI